MVEPRFEPLVFGFQDPGPDDFGRLASRLLGMAETEIDQRRRQARFMVVPSVAFYLLFAFGCGVLLWSLGVELRPVPMAAVSSIAFLVMAGLGMHYEEELDWSGAADGVSRMHRRFLVQSRVVGLMTGAFFTLPAMVIKNLAALFPRRPRVDSQVLAVAANLAAALDEAVSIAGSESIMPRDLEKAVIDQAVLLLVWAGAATVVRRAGQVILQPGPRRILLLSEMTNKNPYVIYLSAMTRSARSRP